MVRRDADDLRAGQGKEPLQLLTPGGALAALNHD
jgi:hypothetical protein